jgi:uncharacterized RDD family membrane protein YckC
MNDNERQYPESLLNADAAADTGTAAGFAESGEPSTAEPRYDFAGFWIRFAANLIDDLFILGLTFLIFNPIRRALGYEPGSLSFVDLVEFIVDMLYMILLTWWSGQTLGKMIMGIRVVSARHTRGSLTLGQVLLREVIGKLLSLIVLGLGYLWVAWSGKKQGWHDMIAKTYVVRERKGKKRPA